MYMSETLKNEIKLNDNARWDKKIHINNFLIFFVFFALVLSFFTINYDVTSNELRRKFNTTENEVVFTEAKFHSA